MSNRKCYSTEGKYVYTIKITAFLNKQHFSTYLLCGISNFTNFCVKMMVQSSQL